jgi:hypothetical protein
MKLIIKFAAYFLLIGAVIFISCKKEPRAKSLLKELNTQCNVSILGTTASNNMSLCAVEFICGDAQPLFFT